MSRIKSFLPLFFVFSLLSGLNGQTGTIAGKLLDAKINDVIIGATIRLDEGTIGCVSDFDGNFALRNVSVGTHKLQISFLGYQTKLIERIEVTAGQEAYISVIMEEESVGNSLKEVVISADVQKETQAAITLLQKNSSFIADGISAQTIRLTPDRTTGDVIKRISGASIQDNRFAVIRGLADRYNMAMLNGSPLTSTEPDRRAFSLDIFPSAMLDNLVVVKTARPDMPGEWAGGAIIITTRDIPTKNFLNLSMSTGYNTLATFKQGVSAQGGKLDWLGYDDGSRDLAPAMPARTDYVNLPLAERINISKTFKNNWELGTTESVAPNLGLQLSTGFIKKLSETAEWGTTIATTYNNNNSLQQGERSDYDNSGQLFGYAQNNAQNNIALGGLVNTALRFNQNHKIGLQALHSTNTSEVIAMREGSNFETEQYVKSNSVEFIENHVLTTRLSGEHLLPKSIKFSWSGGYNRMDRSTPNTRRAFSAKNFDAEEADPFLIDLPPGSATRDRGAIFYSDLNEGVVNGQADFTVPFTAWSQKHNFKFGTLYQTKDRDFAARNLGYIKARSSQFNNQVLYSSNFGNVFDTTNIGEKGFIIDEITNLFDAYTGSSVTNAAYAMLENTLLTRLRVSYGVRMERFVQKLNSYDQTAQPVNVDQTYLDWLPSLNAKYELNEKTNLRLSLSKTTSRPEFREIAPFPFYDYEELATVIGNPNLVRSQIYNADLRYELYPGGNQIISASAFYKYFKNPIEYTLSSLGAGTSNRSYQNVPMARSYGVEVECRKSLGFIADAAMNWTAFANLALIKSRIETGSLNTADKKRPLQGQSPYVLNTGISYASQEHGFNSMLIFNIVGDRLSRVGTANYPDIYEKQRPVLDFSIVKDFGRSQIKCTISDLLRRDLIFYQDNNLNHSYESDSDSVFIRGNRGTTISLTATLKL
jgi:outer membrane receptor protein involved in Fe transport